MIARTLKRSLISWLVGFVILLVTAIVFAAL
jgi:hypothetical protein